VEEGIVKLLNCPPKPNLNWDKKSPEPGSSYTPYKIYNIDNNNPVKLIDFIHILERLIDKKEKIEYLPTQSGDVKETYADITEL
jgi:UDP-glucuronate 4-epimerase